MRPLSQYALPESASRVVYARGVRHQANVGEWTKTHDANTKSGRSTLGAGDTFIAGMLYALQTSATYEQALAFAVGLATKKVQQEGFADLVP